MFFCYLASLLPFAFIIKVIEIRNKNILFLNTKTLQAKKRIIFRSSL